jgi:hypothetical protein
LHISEQPARAAFSSAIRAACTIRNSAKRISTQFAFGTIQTHGGFMLMKRLFSTLALTFLVAVTCFAQQKPGNIASLEFQTPKNGQVKQYEEGRKQKVAWHKQQNDSQPLMVWETISGDNTGTYIVGRLGQHWADFDKPSVPELADLDTYRRLIAANVQSLVTRYYEFLPKVSSADSGGPAKYSEVFTYRVRPGKGEDFRSALNRASEAIVKTKWPGRGYWYVLANGGAGGTYVLVIPHANWADFEDKPDMKPFDEMLKEAFGAEEANSINRRFDSSIESSSSEIIQFRDDLSYTPSK